MADPVSFPHHESQKQNGDPYGNPTTSPLPRPALAAGELNVPPPWVVGQNLWTPEIEYPNGGSRAAPRFPERLHGFQWGDGCPPWGGMGGQEAARG